MFKIINKVADKVNQYLETRVLMVKLGLIERASNLMSLFMLLLISMFIVMLVLFFLGLAMATMFTYLTGNGAIGFLITAMIFLLLLFILMLLRKPILKSFANMYVGLLTEDDEENETEENK